MEFGEGRGGGGEKKIRLRSSKDLAVTEENYNTDTCTTLATHFCCVFKCIIL